MINNSIRLKAKIRNVSGGDDKIAKAYMRLFFMERFLERVSLSSYRNRFILKGGMLISSLLGVDLRATRDIDTTVDSITLSADGILACIKEICGIVLEDMVSFDVTGVESIMDEFDYPGVRVHMEASLDRLKQRFKIDFSTDDVITPGAIEYDYNLLFESRSIRLKTYNTETMMAEKAQTVLARGLANTRMRDYYDLYELIGRGTFSQATAAAAFKATCTGRGTDFSTERAEELLKLISESKDMELMWESFKKNNHFVGDVGFGEVIEAIRGFIGGVCC